MLSSLVIHERYMTRKQCLEQYQNITVQTMMILLERQNLDI